MLEQLAYAVSFLSLGVASYCDLRTREVPDWISYGTIFFGFGTRILFSLYAHSWMPLVSGLLGFLAFLVIGVVMYYTGQWGGGDSKIVMGVGALIGLRPYLHIPELLVFWMFSIFVGAFYGMGYSIYLAAANKKKFLSEFREKRKKHTKKIIAAVVLSLIFFAASFRFSDPVMQTTMLMFPLATLLLIYMWVFVKSVENSAMIKSVPVEKLTEGDWIVEDIVVDGEFIWGPKKLGIEKSKIEKLKKLKEKGKIERVKIKEGIPFVPTFFVSIILTYIFGSINFVLW